MHVALLGTFACTGLQIQRSFGADACMSFSSAINAQRFAEWNHQTYFCGCRAAAPLKLAFVGNFAARSSKCVGRIVFYLGLHCICATSSSISRGAVLRTCAIMPTDYSR